MGWLQVDVGASWIWTVDISDGAAPPETYTSNPALTNAVDALDDLITWANAIVRGWWPNVTLAARWETGPTGRAVPVVYGLGAVPFDWAPDAAAMALFGWSNHTGSSQTSSTGLAGGWYPADGLHIRDRLQVLEGGPAAGVGALRPGVPGSAQQAATCVATCQYSEIIALQTIIRQADQPRTALILDDLSGEWVQCSIGTPTQERLDGLTYRVALPASPA